MNLTQLIHIWCIVSIEINEAKLILLELDEGFRLVVLLGLQQCPIMLNVNIVYSHCPHIFISIRCDHIHPYDKTLSSAFTIKLNLHKLFQLVQLLFSDVGWPEVHDLGMYIVQVSTFFLLTDTHSTQ